GRHGAFQFGRARTVKVTNNVLMNPIMLGTSSIYTDEQTQPDNDAHKVFTVDTLYENTVFEFSANNVFYTQDVLDFFASNDTVSRPAVYSDLILQELGESAENTYFEEELTLTSVPTSILPYVQDLYANPMAEDMFDFVVEDSIVAGTSLDNGNLFNFSNFDPCYGSATTSATADENGGPIGAVGTCNLLTNSYEPRLAKDLNINVKPNPIIQSAFLRYELKQSSAVRLNIYDATGKLVRTLVQEEQQAGEYTIPWNPQTSLNNGLYIARLQTNTGERSLKLILQR
ncbi:MAG: T9SS type A sorting domain-containing protein, partial [Saprospiraceae bacterium]|nr:T9SS type A sorting domain-containing protein [Saprospiraceae bacterium]